VIAVMQHPLSDGEEIATLTYHAFIDMALLRSQQTKIEQLSLQEQNFSDNTLDIKMLDISKIARIISNCDDAILSIHQSSEKDELKVQDIVMRNFAAYNTCIALQMYSKLQKCDTTALEDNVTYLFDSIKVLKTKQLNYTHLLILIYRRWNRILIRRLRALHV